MKDKIKDIWVDLHDELYRFVLAKVGDKALTEDIIQDVFIKVLKNIDRLEQSAKLTAWVYQITRNTIIDHYRKADKNVVYVDSADIPEKGEEDFEYTKLADCINEKINNLASEYKKAIVLTYLKDFSQKEVATYLQLSYSGTKSRVQKARVMLKKDILGCPNVEANNDKIVDFHKE